MVPTPKKQESLSTSRPHPHHRPDRDPQSLLVELLHEVKVIGAAIINTCAMVPLAKAIPTEVPLSKKAAAASLGLTLSEFNRMIERDELKDGRHFIALGGSIILRKNVLDLIADDRRKAAECRPKPSTLIPPKKHAVDLDYTRISS